jgi:pimeloyl-ACP methyl ester carboxylesterase
LSTDVRYALPDLRQPLTVLYPWTEGRIMSASACDDLYASAYVATPELRLQRVDGSLHFIMLDQPDTFAAAVKAFLDE